MKSHSQVPSFNPAALAKKINRAGIANLLPEEQDFVSANLSAVAFLCTYERAVEAYRHYEQDIPKGLVCTPVPGEKDAYISRLKDETDRIYKAW